MLKTGDGSRTKPSTSVYLLRVCVATIVCLCRRLSPCSRPLTSHRSPCACATVRSFICADCSWKCTVLHSLQAVTTVYDMDQPTEEGDQGPSPRRSCRRPVPTRSLGAVPALTCTWVLFLPCPCPSTGLAAMSLSLPPSLPCRSCLSPACTHPCPYSLNVAARYLNTVGNVSVHGRPWQRWYHGRTADVQSRAELVSGSGGGSLERSSGP